MDTDSKLNKLIKDFEEFKNTIYTSRDIDDYWSVDKTLNEINESFKKSLSNLFSFILQIILIFVSIEISNNLKQKDFIELLNDSALFFVLILIYLLLLKKQKEIIKNEPSYKNLETIKRAYHNKLNYKN